MIIPDDLTQRHVDALCATYGAPVQDQGQSDEDYASIKRIAAADAIARFIDEVADSYDINTAVNTARVEAAQASARQVKAVDSIQKLPTPTVSPAPSVSPEPASTLPPS